MFFPTNDEIVDCQFLSGNVFAKSIWFTESCEALFQEEVRCGNTRFRDVAGPVAGRSLVDPTRRDTRLCEFTSSRTDLFVYVTSNTHWLTMVHFPGLPFGVFRVTFPGHGEIVFV